MYSLVHLNISPRLTITSSGVFNGPLVQKDEDGHFWDIYTKKIAVPSHFPLFKESPFALNDRSFHVEFPRLEIGVSQYYPMTAILT
jgi:hypothetical protein